LHLTKHKLSQFVFALVAMAIIGSIYGWSTTAAIIAASTTWSARQAASVFGMLSAGIGIGVVFSGVLLPALGYARTIAAGLMVWGLALLVLSQVGFAGSSGTLCVILAIFAGAGTGIAYLALVSFFRTLFAAPTVISGLIGPLGFAIGASAISLVQAIRPSVDTVVDVYCAFGVGALLLAVMITFFLVEPPLRSTTSKTTIAGDGGPGLLYLWALLSLNVVPGMAIIAVAIPWFRNTRPWSFHEATLALCAVVFSLPIGQALWGLLADRFGDRAVFLLMFSIRCLAFAAVSLSPRSVWPWSLSLVCLACHGGGFGLVPGMVAKSRMESDSRRLGLVLSGWGVGGVVGVAAIFPAVDNPFAQRGYAIIAGLMAVGALLSVKFRIAGNHTTTS
jgi:Major Facilitator Superfamily